MFWYFPSFKRVREISFNYSKRSDFVGNAEDWKNSSAKAYSLDDKSICSFDIEFVR